MIHSKKKVSLSEKDQAVGGGWSFLGPKMALDLRELKGFSALK